MTTVSAIVITVGATAMSAFASPKVASARFHKAYPLVAKHISRRFSDSLEDGNSMTVVIGITTSDSIILASDGYALEQEDSSNPIIKQDFYSKISLLGNGKYLIGSAGSHELIFSISEHVSEIGDQLSENELVESVRLQLSQLNIRDSARKTALLLGFLSESGPALFVFTPEGEAKREDRMAALGSGADWASEWFCAHCEEPISFHDAILCAVEAVYQASKSPTVNFVPMLAFITPSGNSDLSGFTRKQFKDFKLQLKSDLARQALLTIKGISEVPGNEDALRERNT